MTDIQTYLNARSDRGLFAAQTFAARFPTEQGGAMGPWSAQVDYCTRWDARITPHTPMGTILFEPHGFLRIELADFQGWKPFIAIAGMQAGRQLQATIAYSYDGSSTYMTTDQGQWDPTMTLYEMFGATSDGTLAGAGLTSSITVAALDLQPWTIDYAFVGWTQVP